MRVEPSRDPGTQALRGQVRPLRQASERDFLRKRGINPLDIPEVFPHTRVRFAGVFNGQPAIIGLRH